MPIWRRKLQILSLTICLGLGFPGDGWGQEIVAVLSSDSGPYRTAFKHFQKAMGREIPSIILEGGEPTLSRKTRLVVAFGGKAAQASYPNHVGLVYCLAPGTVFGVRDSKVFTVEVKMFLPPRTFLSILKELQPDLKSLAVLWSARALSDYVDLLGIEAPAWGLEVIPVRMDNPEELPDRLRGVFNKKADAVWLMPDPILVNARSFSLIKDFSRANRIPFYAPTSGLAAQGATGSISVGFEEIGRASAAAAHQGLNGKFPEAGVYPEKPEVVIDLKSAGQIGMVLPPAAIRKADKILP